MAAVLLFLVFICFLVFANSFGVIARGRVMNGVVRSGNGRNSRQPKAVEEEKCDPFKNEHWDYRENMCVPDKPTSIETMLLGTIVAMCILFGFNKLCGTEPFGHEV